MRWKSVASVGMLLPAGVAIGTYMYFGSLSRLLADDYCSIYLGRRLGFLRSIWYWYLEWHGGFSASVADWILSFFGPKLVPFVAFILLTSWIGFASIAMREILSYKRIKAHAGYTSLLMGFFLVYSTLLICADIPQSLFWWGGARAYLTPLIFFTAYIALFYHFITLSLNRFQKTIWLLVSFGLSFLIGGFSEVFTPVQVVLFTGLVGIGLLSRQFSVKDGKFQFLSAGFLGALFSLVIMISAPGNANRQLHFPPPPGLYTVLSVSFEAYLKFLRDIFGTFRMLAGMIGITLGSVWLGMEMNQERELEAAKPNQSLIAPLILLIGFILAFGCFPPAVYGTSEAPPARTLIIPSFFLIVCLLTAGFLFGGWLRTILVRKIVPSTILLVACGLIIISAYATLQNLYLQHADFVSFAQQWDRVDQEIKTAEKLGLKEITIPSMKNWAGLEYPNDHARYWPNVCYSQYYNISVFGPPFQP